MTTQTPQNTAGTQSISLLEVRFTNPDEFVEEVKRDLGAGHVQDKVIRLASRKAAAYIADVEPDRPFDNRVNRYWRKWYVEASYISTRHQLVKLSCYCGVIMEPEPLGRLKNDEILATSETTEKELRSVLRKVQRELVRFEGLDIRGGGLFIEDGVWMASPEDAIEAPEAVSCATCRVRLYWANGHWRDESGRFEVTVEKPGRFGPIQALDHEHAPASEEVPA